MVDRKLRAAPEAGAYTTSAGRSRNMAAIRRSGTKPEVSLRSELHGRGLRFRKDLPLRIENKLIRPDVVFTRVRLAVFVDGCFWHCCPDHGRSPSVNTGYWSPKLQANVERDRTQTALLEGAGWTVVRVWEHEPLSLAAAKVEATRRKLLAEA